MGLRLLKLIGVLALLVVLLFVSLPFLLPELIARNKSALESLLSDSLGAELRFGNAEIELFPIPEVRITEARISKKMTGAIGEMLADAPSLRLQNNVMPLLMGKL